MVGSTAWRGYLAAMGALLVSLCVAGPASAATISSGTPTPFIDNFADDGVCSLREMIQIANTNNVPPVEDACAITDPLGDDTVQLAAGTYELTRTGAADDTNLAGDLDALTGLNNDLIIDGAGTAMTRIDTYDVVPWTERVLHGIGGVLTVSDLTIADGHTTTGGYPLGSGGGIFSASGALSLLRVRVTESTSVAGGGGVTGIGTALTITDSTIETNMAAGGTAGFGGGVQTNAMTTTIDSSVIRGNGASHADTAMGGGIFASVSPVTITDSVIAENHATITDVTGVPDGGGVHLQDDSLTLRRTTIAENEVVGGDSRLGGGINMSGGTLTLVNSTVSGNEALGAMGHGAGLAVNNGTATIAHSTFGPNPVNPGEASAMERIGGTLNVRGSAIETHLTSPACGGTIVSLDDNVFTDSSCGAEPGPGGNDDADANLQLGLLQDNGGPGAGAPGFLAAIETHLPAVSSPVTDHVPEVDCDDAPVGSLTDDQRGVTRPTDTDGDSVAACEAGSVEVPFPTPPPVIPPVVVPAAAVENPLCAALRAKLKKAKTKKKKKKIRKRLKALGC